MKRILCLIIFLCSSSFSQGFPYDKYSAIDLLDLITTEDSYAKESNIPLDNRYSIMPAVRYSSIVEYAGEKREISDVHKIHLADVIKSIPSIPKAQIDTYTSEILIKVGGKEVWALIQEKVLPYLEREIKVGDKVKIYYFYFGAHQRDHIIAINEFEVQPGA